MHATRLVATAAVTLIGVGGAGAAAPPVFELIFDGNHDAALLHEGTFTTSSAWCLSGSATDVSIDDATLTASRQFTCAGGSDFLKPPRPTRAVQIKVDVTDVVGNKSTSAKTISLP